MSPDASPDRSPDTSTEASTEADLVDLLHAIGDRAPAPTQVLERLALSPTPITPVAHRGPPVNRRVAALSAVAAVALVAGVTSLLVSGGGAGDPDAASRLGAPARTVDHATYRLPLDAYYASDTQKRTLQRAQFVLAQRCASTHGVNVPTPRFPVGDDRVPFLALIANNVRPLTLQQARTLGYDLYPSGTYFADHVVATLTPAQLEVFQGWSAGRHLPKPTDRFLLTGGCLGQATRTLLRGATPARVPGQITADGQPGLFDDDVVVETRYLNAARAGENAPSVRRAQTRWAACMAAHGYPGIRSTENAIVHQSDVRSAKAKRQAGQDVDCKQSTGFMTVWISSMRQAQAAVVAAHRAALNGAKQRLATRMRNAAAALR